MSVSRESDSHTSDSDQHQPPARSAHAKITAPSEKPKNSAKPPLKPAQSAQQPTQPESNNRTNSTESLPGNSSPAQSPSQSPSTSRSHSHQSTSRRSRSPSHRSASGCCNRSDCSCHHMNMFQLIFELSELLPEGLRRIAKEEPHRVRPGLLDLVHHASRMILHGLDVAQITHDILHQPLDDSNDRYKDEFNRQNLGDPTNDQTEAGPPGQSRSSGTPQPNPNPNQKPHQLTTDILVNTAQAKPMTAPQSKVSIPDNPDQASEETQEPDVPESASLPEPHDLPSHNDLDAHTSNSDSDWGSDTDYTATAIHP